MVDKHVASVRVLQRDYTDFPLIHHFTARKYEPNASVPLHSTSLQDISGGYKDARIEGSEILDLIDELRFHSSTVLTIIIARVF